MSKQRPRHFDCGGLIYRYETSGGEVDACSVCGEPEPETENEAERRMERLDATAKEKRGDTEGAL